MQPEWLKENVTTYAIVNISVANLRANPVYQSEMVNQALLGSVLPVFEEQNDFCFVENWDGYRGWLSQASIVRMSYEQATAWDNRAQTMFSKNYGVVKPNGDLTGETLLDLVLGDRLAQIDVSVQSLKVELPDGRTGYVSKADCSTMFGHTDSTASADDIEQHIRQFMGAPYLWGGITPKGVDCSGLIQTAFRLGNYQLQRNAAQMARLGKEVAVEMPELWKKGDLLFFGKQSERITHVAFYSGDGEYIHADGRVRVNSIDPDSALYNEKRKSTILKVVRVLGG